MPSRRRSSLFTTRQKKQRRINHYLSFLNIQRNKAVIWSRELRSLKIIYKKTSQFSSKSVIVPYSLTLTLLNTYAKVYKLTRSNSQRRRLTRPLMRRTSKTNFRTKLSRSKCLKWIARIVKKVNNRTKARHLKPCQRPALRTWVSNLTPLLSLKRKEHSTHMWTLTKRIKLKEKVTLQCQTPKS